MSVLPACISAVATRNLMLGTLMKIGPENPFLVKIGQKYGGILRDDLSTFFCCLQC